MIECLICHKIFGIISPTHLKRHNITCQEYKNMFPNAIFFDKEEIAKRSQMISGENNPAKRLEVREKMRKAKENYIPWNVGIPRTIEEKTKISEGRKGKRCGNNHPNKRPEVGRKISNTRKQKGLSKEENNPNWKGGISYFPYCPKFNEDKKEEIRNQYNRKCYCCRKDEKDNILKSSGLIKKLSVHHIDSDKEQGCNGKEFKLIPVCMNCHIKLHWNKIILEKL